MRDHVYPGFQEASVASGVTTSDYSKFIWRGTCRARMHYEIGNRRTTGFSSLNSNPSRILFTNTILYSAGYLLVPWNAFRVRTDRLSQRSRLESGRRSASKPLLARRHECRQQRLEAKSNFTFLFVLIRTASLRVTFLTNRT